MCGLFAVYPFFFSISSGWSWGFAEIWWSVIGAFAAVNLAGVVLRRRFFRRAVGDAAAYHGDWRYLPARPVRRLIGWRCETCHKRVYRRSQWVQGLAPLARRPRFFKKPRIWLGPKGKFSLTGRGDPWYVGYAYCEPCGSAFRRRQKASAVAPGWLLSSSGVLPPALRKQERAAVFGTAAPAG